MPEPENIKTIWTRELAERFKKRFGKYPPAYVPLADTTEYQKQRIRQIEQAARLKELTDVPLSRLDSLALKKKPPKPIVPKKPTEVELARGSFERVISPKGGSPYDTATVAKYYPGYWKERTKKPKSAEEKEFEALEKQVKLIKLEEESAKLTSVERKPFNRYYRTFNRWKVLNDQIKELPGGDVKNKAKTNRKILYDQLIILGNNLPIPSIEKKGSGF